MNILVTGACGYKGSVLIPKLLLSGHNVTAFDIMWFGNHLSNHKDLEVIEGDIRNANALKLEGYDAIIHLASVANDPCSDLNPMLTWEISCLATMQLADKAARSGVKHFIYASSGSVYGIKDESSVTEDLELVPLSEYNKTKMVAERVLLSYANSMTVQIIRPATVCGLSPRMRLDVAVNLLTMQALTKHQITVLGGNQTRPNIHIDDVTDLYIYLINNPNIHGVFNAGFENLSIMDIANLVSKHTGAEIITLPSNDPRSYRVNSDKIEKHGFAPKKGVENAIIEIKDAFNEGLLSDIDNHYNLKWMQKLNLDIK
jgi:nucleoside-diphosphate-sugar epimerase